MVKTKERKILSIERNDNAFPAFLSQAGVYDWYLFIAPSTRWISPSLMEIYRSFAETKFSSPRLSFNTILTGVQLVETNEDRINIKHALFADDDQLVVTRDVVTPRSRNMPQLPASMLPLVSELLDLLEGAHHDLALIVARGVGTSVESFANVVAEGQSLGLVISPNPNKLMISWPTTSQQKAFTYTRIKEAEKFITNFVRAADEYKRQLQILKRLFDS